MNLERLESLVGSTNLEKIKSLNILIVGIGGVGGYTLESLVRCGVENITIVDFDKVESSNLNRQIISSLTNIGKLKVEVAKERYSNINNKLNLKCLPIFLNKDNINKINIEEYDYVVDACDSVNTKVLLMQECILKNIKIIKKINTKNKIIKNIKLSKEKYTADILTTKTKRQKKTKRGFLYKTRQIDYKRK